MGSVTAARAQTIARILGGKGGSGRPGKRAGGPAGPAGRRPRRASPASGPAGRSGTRAGGPVGSVGPAGRRAGGPAGRSGRVGPAGQPANKATAIPWTGGFTIQWEIYREEHWKLAIPLGFSGHHLVNRESETVWPDSFLLRLTT